MDQDVKEPYWDQQAQERVRTLQCGPSDAKEAALKDLWRHSGMLQSMLIDCDGLRVLAELLVSSSGQRTADDNGAWRTMTWELLARIMHSKDSMKIPMPPQYGPIFTALFRAFRSETEPVNRRHLLRFLLARPHRSATYYELMTHDGGLAMLVNALSCEKEAKTADLLVKLLCCIAAAGQQYALQMNLIVQTVAKHPTDMIYYENLLALYGDSESMKLGGDHHGASFCVATAADVLRLGAAPEQTIVLCQLLRHVKSVAMAFVLEFGGLTLLWDILMLQENREIQLLALELLRTIVVLDDAYRDHLANLVMQPQYTRCRARANAIRDVVLRSQALQLEAAMDAINEAGTSGQDQRAKLQKLADIAPDGSDNEDDEGTEGFYDSNDGSDQDWQEKEEDDEQDVLAQSDFERLTIDTDAANWGRRQSQDCGLDHDWEVVSNPNDWCSP